VSDSESDNQTDQNVEEQPRYYVELVEEIITQLEDFFSSHLTDMFKKADEYLFDAANTASSTAEQNGLFECMNSIRANKTEIQQGFIDELSIYLQPVCDLKELPAKKHKKKPAALGLVEQNEMDEMVTLASISSKAAMDNAEAINHLVKRFKELSQYNDHIFHAEAIEPKHLCESMQDSVTKTDLIDANKLVVYQFFDTALIKDLGKLYETLNNLLIDQGILPEIDFGGMAPHYDIEEPAEEEAPGPSSTPPPPPPGGRRAFGSGMGGGPRPPMPQGGPGGPPPMQGGGAPQQGGMPMQGGADAPQGGMPMQSGGYGSGSSGPRRAFGSGMQSFTPQAPMQSPGNVGDQGYAGAQGVVGPSGQQTSAGVPVAQVQQSIESFIGGSHADVMSAGNANYYSHQQVMTALTGLQEPPDELSKTPLVFDANQIKKAVLSSIGETEGGAVTKAVNQVSEKTIDFIKLIFDAIIDEESITDEIKTLLLSLQIPVIKAAMLEAEFFIDDQHPARQLLDKITEAGVGVSEHTDPVYIQIEQIVRKLLKDYDEDVVAFSVALDELKELTEEIYSKARENEEKSQQAVKMAHAKEIVLREIRKITLGKELPQGVRTLVLKVWPSMMFNHFLKFGKANDDWVELLMILQKIIESVQPLHTVSELEELGLTHHDIIDAVRKKISKSHKHKEMLDAVMAELEATYETLMATKGLEDENTPQIDSELVEKVAQSSPEYKEPVQQDAVEKAQADELTDESAGAEETSKDLHLEPEEAVCAGDQDASSEAEEEENPEIIAKAKIAKLPEGVAPGAWFIVYNGEERPVRRLKLAVILVQDATMVFVDHLGNVVIEKDAEVFAEEIEKSLSGIIMQHSVFDHALSSALQTIEH